MSKLYTPAHAQSLCCGSSCLMAAEGGRRAGPLPPYLVDQWLVRGPHVCARYRGPVTCSMCFLIRLCGSAWRRCVNAQAGSCACRLQLPARIGKRVPVQQHGCANGGLGGPVYSYVYQESCSGPLCWRTLLALDWQRPYCALACSRWVVTEQTGTSLGKMSSSVACPWQHWA